MNKALSIPFLVAALIWLAACKKNTDGKLQPAEGLLVKDASVPDNFGLKINISQYGLPKMRGGHLWTGPNTLLVAAESDLILIDFSQENISNIAPASGGLILGRTDDQASVLFMGSVDGIIGFNTWKIPGGPVDKVLSLGPNEGGTLIMNGNRMLAYLGQVSTQGRPCESPWDFWCGSSTALTSEQLYYVEKGSLSPVDLGKYFPVLFSGDGNYAVVKDTAAWLLHMDSLSLSGPIALAGSRFFWKGLLIGYGVETAPGSNFSQIVVRNILGDFVVSSYDAESQLQENQVYVSEDQQVIVYTGPCPDGSCSYAIWYLDRSSGTTQKLVWTTAGAGSSPFEEICISTDDHKIAYRYFNDLYLKEW